MIRTTVAVASLLLGVGACGGTDPVASSAPATSATTAAEFCTAWSQLPSSGDPVPGVETHGTPPSSAELYAPLIDLAPPEISADVRSFAATADLGSPESAKKFAAANARVTAWVEQNC